MGPSKYLTSLLVISQLACSATEFCMQNGQNCSNVFPKFHNSQKSLIWFIINIMILFPSFHSPLLLSTHLTEIEQCFSWSLVLTELLAYAFLWHEKRGHMRIIIGSCCPPNEIWFKNNWWGRMLYVIYWYFYHFSLTSSVHIYRIW